MEERLSNEGTTNSQKNKIVLSSFVKQVFIMADTLKNEGKKRQTKQIRAKKKELKKSLAKCLKVLDVQDSRKSEEIERLDNIYEEEVFLRLYCTTQNRKHSTEGRLCLTEELKIPVRFVLSPLNRITKRMSNWCVVTNSTSNVFETVSRT